MKVIIAGGRNTHISLCEMDKEICKSNFPVTLVVSGGADGIDELGEVWALQNSIPIVKFTAQWHQYGYAAGPIRNIEMAEYADALIAFPGGKGTKNIIEQMQKLKKDVYISEIESKTRWD